MMFIVDTMMYIMYNYFINKKGVGLYYEQTTIFI